MRATCRDAGYCVGHCQSAALPDTPQAVQPEYDALVRDAMLWRKHCRAAPQPASNAGERLAEALQEMVGPHTSADGHYLPINFTVTRKTWQKARAALADYEKERGR